tara:strand:- start:574 stop:894 length:321 start_codon:yes stop_codon:yes gene_type:complete
MSVRCEVCQGKGTTETTVYAQEIMLIVLHNVEDGKVQKINAIKQVRNEYGMGLKQAKELVEGAMKFYYAIENHATQIPNPNSARDEYHAYDSEEDLSFTLVPQSKR